MYRSQSLLRFAPLCVLLLAPDAAATEVLCHHSPENPTVVLGLLSSAAAAYPFMRERLRSLRRRRGSVARQEDRS